MLYIPQGEIMFFFHCEKCINYSFYASIYCHYHVLWFCFKPIFGFALVVGNAKCNSLLYLNILSGKGSFLQKLSKIIFRHLIRKFSFSRQFTTNKIVYYHRKCVIIALTYLQQRQVSLSIKTFVLKENSSHRQLVSSPDPYMLHMAAVLPCWA